MQVCKFWKSVIGLHKKAPKISQRNWKWRLLNYVLYVLSCLMPHVRSCNKCLVLYVPCASRTSFPTCSRASCRLCPTCSCALSVSYHTCLVSYVASCLTLYDPFFLTYPIVSITLKWRSVFINNMIYLNYLKPNTKTYT